MSSVSLDVEEKTPGKWKFQAWRTLPTGLVAWTGLLPGASVVCVVLALAVRTAGVSVTDALIFVAYVLAFLTLPGTLIWRLVVKPGPTLNNDLVLGTILGFVLEAPVYLLLRLVGAPSLIYLFPVLMVVGVLAFGRSRALGGPLRMTKPTVWSWGTAGIVVVQSLYVAKDFWAARPLDNLRGPYVDEPFHLAVAGDLLHHFPAQMAWVEGTPLFYHWLVYVHLASAATVTHIELIALLRVLSVALIMVLAVAGVYATAVRLTGRSWTGFVAALVLGFGATQDLFGWTALDRPVLSLIYNPGRPFLSPTHGYVVILQMVLIVLIIEALRRGRLRAAPWVLTAAVMVAVAGAKSSAMPTIVCGLLAVFVMAAVLRNGRVRVAGGLFATAVVVFLAAGQAFYGGGTRAMKLSLTGTVGQYAGGVNPDREPLPVEATVAMWVCLVVFLALLASSVIGLVIRKGWRLPEVQFLVGTLAAAFGAFMLLSHPGVAQAYIFFGAAPFTALIPALALSTLLPSGVSRRGVAVIIGCGVLGALALVVAGLLTGTEVPDTVDGAAATLLTHLAVGGAILLGVVVAVMIALRRFGAAPISPVVGLVAVMLGVSLAGAPLLVKDAVIEPAASRTVPSGLIGQGGIAAARYVRAHSDPGDLVATNAHCESKPVPNCSRRNFWIAAYAERRVLVEGWAYIDPTSVGLPSNDLTNSSYLPFWDPERLADNDAAFTDPSVETLGTLADEYGVDWLVVDKRFPKDLAAMKQLLKPVFRAGAYVVFDLDDLE